MPSFSLRPLQDVPSQGHSFMNGVSGFLLKRKGFVGPIEIGPGEAKEIGAR